MPLSMNTPSYFLNFFRSPTLRNRNATSGLTMVVVLFEIFAFRDSRYSSVALAGAR